jgi:hypothetical protein
VDTSPSAQPTRQYIRDDRLDRWRGVESLPPLSIRPFHARLEKAGVRIVPSRAVYAVMPGRVRLSSVVTEAPAEELAFDTLIYSGGHEPDSRGLEGWSERVSGSVHLVGDAYAARGLGVAGRGALQRGHRRGHHRLGSEPRVEQQLPGRGPGLDVGMCLRGVLEWVAPADVDLQCAFANHGEEVC